ncbi:MAG: patatin-like phospholipase family protein [Alphaproteobacteria bacterium]|nr:patatin-like phospholipase family protein [Alphaproteobacteria bacterium]
MQNSTNDTPSLEEIKKEPQSAPFDECRIVKLKASEVRVAPYRYCGNLLIHFLQLTGDNTTPKICTGSGVLIGPNHVLTAGHNIYDHEKGGWAKEIIFTPCQHNKSKPFGEARGIILKTFNKWINGKGKEYEYDMGLIILDNAIGYKAGWAGLISLNDEFYESSREFRIAGYPNKGVKIQKQQGKYKIKSAQMYEHSGRVKEYKKKRLYYEINTRYGQSGSPILARIKRKDGVEGLKGYYVVGVHTHGFDASHKATEGTCLTEERLKNILTEVSKYVLLSSSSDSPELLFNYMMSDEPIIASSISTSSSTSEAMSTRTLTKNDITLEDHFKDNLQNVDPKKITIAEATRAFKDEKRRPLYEVLGQEDAYLKGMIKGGTPVNYFTALSIDGGGIRGLIPALLLEYLSRQVPGHNLYEIFDYIGGASVGGVISLGLTAPSPTDLQKTLLTPADIVTIFKDRAEEIFHKNFWGRLEVFHILSPRYDAFRFEQLLKEKFGQCTYLHQLLTNTMVVALERNKSKIFAFDSFHARRLISEKLDIKIPIWEVGRSATATPTYFSSHTLMVTGTDNIKFEGDFLDGGLFLNNPAGLLLTHLQDWAQRERIYCDNKNVVMLSLGTGHEEPQPLPSSSGRLVLASPLFNHLMQLNDSAVDGAMRDKLGDNYLRINPKLEHDIMPDTFRTEDLELLEETAKLSRDKIDELVTGDKSIFRKILEAGEFLPKLSQPENNDKGKARESNNV